MSRAAAKTATASISSAIKRRADPTPNQTARDIDVA
jgi:hypothetical protein